jgi:hypothetical protein
MNPELKFHSVIVSLSTLVIFTVWTQLTILVSKYPALSVITASLISIGMYRLLTIVMLAAFRNFPLVKKWILGASYMEGTWVGFFIGHDDTARLYVESFEQDLSGLVIRGKAFKTDKTYHGTWISDNANINARLGSLTYTYEANVIGNSHTNQGLAAFTFERNERETPPYRMIGFSSDLFNPKKLKSFEEKVTNGTTMCVNEAIEKAEEVYLSNKDNF